MHHVEPRRTLPSAVTDHPLFTREEEREAFLDLRRTRVDAWVAVLSDRRLAPRCLPGFASGLPQHPVWDSAREAAVMRPTKANLAAMAQVAAPLAEALLAGDACGEALQSSVAGVGRLAPRASTPAAWVRRVGDSMAALARAVDHVERHNLRLVTALAKPFRRRAQDMTLGDLVGYGAMGLRKAVLHFDVSKGLKFSTYATFWIKHHIRRATQDFSRTIRIPVHMLEKMTLATGQMSRGEDPGERGRAVLSLAREAIVVSGDKPLMTAGDEWQETILTVTPAPEGDPGEEIDAARRRELLTRLLDGLDDRSRLVVEARFGLLSADGEPSKLDEVGRAIGCSREWARRLEDAAILRMRRRAQELASPAPAAADESAPAREEAPFAESAVMPALHRFVSVRAEQVSLLM